MTKRKLRSNAKSVQNDNDNIEISDGAKTYLDELLREHTAELKSEIDALKTMLSQKKRSKN